MRFAITTPTGRVGSKLVNELLLRGGHQLTLLTRKSDSVRDAVGRGARAMQGKLEDMDFFARATEGVDALFLVIPMDSHSENMFRDCTRIIGSACNAIKKNSIPRVVFVSSIGTHLEKDTGPIHILREAEQKLRDTAPNLTVLRPVFYMDQVMGWMQDIAEEGAFYAPLAARTGIPMIATRDVASFAADVLTDANWTGRRILSLHGPREYSFAETAKILGKTLGTDVRYVEVKTDEAAKRLRRRGWREEAVTSNLELQRMLGKGIADELPPSEWKIRPTTFEEFARKDFQPAFEKLATVGAST